MSEENAGCPECRYVWYLRYEEVEIPQTATGIATDEEDPIYEKKEVPVAVKTPRGYLCRLCRHEWKEDGTPVDRETIEQSVASFRKYGPLAHTEIHGLKGSTKGGE